MSNIRCDKCKYSVRTDNGLHCKDAPGYTGTCTHPDGGPNDYFELYIKKSCSNCLYSVTGNHHSDCAHKHWDNYSCWVTKEVPTLKHGDEESVDGLKYDVHKVDLTFLEDWDLALAALCELSAFGAEKYERSGWKKIDDPKRLKASMLRHYFAEQTGELDPDSGVMHDVATAWNALSALQIRLQNTPPVST